MCVNEAATSSGDVDGPFYQRWASGQQIVSGQEQGVDAEGNLGGLIFTDMNDPEIAASRVIPDDVNKQAKASNEIADVGVK